MNFSAVILAGGRSSRMGRDKAFLDWNGRPLLAHQIEKIRGLKVDQLFISGRRDTDYSGFGCPVLHDAFLDCGPLAGIERALEASQGSHLLVLAIDMPVIATAFLGKLIQSCTETQGVVPTVDGVIQPMPAVYPKTTHQIASTMLGKKLCRVTRFAESCLESDQVRPYVVFQNENSHFANWNTPADRPQNKS